MEWFTTTGRGENDMRRASVLVPPVYVHMPWEQNDSNSLRLCSSYLLFRAVIFSAAICNIFSQNWECLHMKTVQFIFLMITEAVCILNKTILYPYIFLVLAF